MSKQGINERLLKASEFGDLDTVLECIRNGADVNVKGPDMWTPLGNAAYYGHNDIVKALIDAGADIKAKNGTSKETALHIALKERRLGTVLVLLQANEISSIINLKDKNGDTPLHWATSYGRLDIVEAMIDVGADPNKQDKNGWTPLHWAASSGYVALLKFLVDNGANINIKNKNGLTPLNVATRENQVDCVLALAEHETKSIRTRKPRI